MGNRVISIEVGKSITRAVEMDYKVKNPKIYSCFSFETPVGVLEDGIVRQDDNFCNVLKGAMKHFRVKTKKVVFTVSSGRIANRDIKIPFVKDNRIAGMLMANSAEYFPVDLTQYQLVHRIVEKVDNKKAKKSKPAKKQKENEAEVQQENEAGNEHSTNEKYIKLSVLAVPNDLVMSYERLAQDCGLTLVAMDYVGNSVGQVMKKAVQDPGTVLIKVDENSSMITITKNGEIDLQRNIAYGVEDAIETMIGSNAYGSELSYADALQIMRRRTCIRRHLDVEMGYMEEEDIDQTIATARAEITEALRMLIGNIGRVLDYYVSRNSDTDIRHIKLIGLGADCSGLSKLMTNELGIKVTAFQEYAGAAISRGLDASGLKIAEYVSCIGASIDPLNFRFGDNKDVGGSESSGSLMLPGLVFLVCVVASASLVGYCMLNIRSLNKEKASCNARITDLYPAKQSYDVWSTANQELQSCRSVYELTNTPMDNFMEYLQEMESNVPSDLMITSLTVAPQGITMNVSFSSKESLAEMLIQLRKFETINNVSCTSVSQADNDAGGVDVNATIICAFTNAVAVAAEE